MPKTPSKYLDLYAILKIKKSASPTDVKKAYRKLCKKHHPDIGGDPEKFHQIHIAYSILMNGTNREKYDSTGQYSEQQLQSDGTELANMLTNLFKAVVQSGIPFRDDVDLIERMRKGVQEHKDNISISTNKNSEVLESLKKIQDRISVAEGVEGPFMSVLLTQLHRLEQEHAKFEQAGRVIQLLDEELQRYTCITDIVHSANVYTWRYMSTSTSTL